MSADVPLHRDDTWLNTVRTDDDGRWSVAGLTPGRYHVSFGTPDRGRTQ